MEKMLAYYDCKNIKEFGEKFGFYNEVDAKRFLIEKYEDDVVWEEIK